MARAPDKILDPVARGSLYPTEPVKSAEGVIRIDLDVAGSGEISAAISLLRTVCPVLRIAASTSAAKLYIYEWAASGAQPAAELWF